MLERKKTVDLGLAKKEKFHGRNFVTIVCWYINYYEANDYGI